MRYNRRAWSETALEHFLTAVALAPAWLSWTSATCCCSCLIQITPGHTSSAVETALTAALCGSRKHHKVWRYQEIFHHTNHHPVCMSWIHQHFVAPITSQCAYVWEVSAFRCADHHPVCLCLGFTSISLRRSPASVLMSWIHQHFVAPIITQCAYVLEGINSAFR